MKKLVLFGLIIAGAASGCIISSGDDGSGDGTITAHWDIKKVDGTSLTCPPTYDTAALYSQTIDANFNNVGSPVIDLFDCSAFTANSAPLAPTTYYSWVAIETHDGSQTYASTVSAFVDLTTTDKTFSADIYDDGGYFQMAWQLTAKSSGAPVLCADVAGITGVEAISTEVGNASNAASDIFHCGDHYGVTSVLPEGNYTVHVDALNSSNQSIGDAADLTNQPISGPNKVTNLHTITIPIAAL